MRLYQQLFSYAVAIVSTAISLLLRLWLEPFLPRPIGIFFYIAIMVSTWYGGWRPGLVATLSSTLAIQYFLMPPLSQFWVNQSKDRWQLLIFVIFALVLVWLTHNVRENQRYIEQLNQQQAQENTAQLRMALQAAKMGLWDWNLETGELNWSPEHEQLFGFAPASFDGRYQTFEACVHPEDRLALQQAVEQALQTHSSYHHEFRILWPDGSLHWMEGRGHAFYNEAGQPIRMSGTVMNIDSRKQAETLLHQQFEQQRLVMEVTQRIRRSLHLQEILQTTVEEVRQLLQTDRVIIFQFDSNWSGTVVVESVATEWTAILSTQICDPCFGKDYVEPYRQGLVTTKSDIYTAGIDACHRELLANFQVRANLVVPVLQGDNLWGLLIAHHCTEPREWKSSEIELLRQLAAQVGIAIQQSILFEQVQAELLERQRVEQALSESEARLQMAIEAANLGTWHCEVSTLRCFFSPRSKVILGLPVEQDDYHYADFNRVLHPDDRQRVNQTLTEIFTNLQIYHCEYRVVWPDGTVRWILSFGQPVFDNAHNLTIYIGCLLDITERKQVEMALQHLNTELEQRVAERTAELTEAERRWRFLLDNVQLIVIGLDNKGFVNYANPFFFNLTGYRESEVLGKNWIENFIPVSSRQMLQAVCAEIRASNAYPYYQNFILTQSGEERLIAWNNTLLRDVTGNMIGTISIGEDITERYKIEKIKNEFIGIVSHELRTPLTAIRASLGLLQTGIYDKQPHKFKRMIEIATTDSERLIRLVNDILDLERLESGHVVFDKALCQATELIEQAVAGVKEIAQQQRITLLIYPTDIEVWAACDAIVQTLTNLLSNAIKFSPPDSTITLTVEQHTDHVLFQVSDQGRGIPADKLESIFGRFNQVDVSDSRQKGGTGLGLAICQSIIEQHGGRIWAESILGAGSTFFFTVPVSPEEV
jgi:PAS domain S-box-containing protein